MPTTGYEDIDELQNQTEQLYNQQMEQQKNIIDIGTQQAIDEIERNKKEAEEQAEKTNRALYTDYQKQINPYGVNAEDMAEQGLGKSGLAETTKANYYNTYQSARTEAQNNANKIKADFDAKMVQARQNGDLQMAQAALAMYQQRVNDMYNLYNLRYQKEQDTLAQENWQKEYEQALQNQQWQQQFNQSQFDYQKERDEIADRQWQEQFDLQRRNTRSGGSRGSSGGTIDLDNNAPSQDQVLQNMRIMQGVNRDGTPYTRVKDEISGKTFNSPAELLEYYGY